MSKSRIANIKKVIQANKHLNIGTSQIWKAVAKIFRTKDFVHAGLCYQSKLIIMGNSVDYCDTYKLLSKLRWYVPTAVSGSYFWPCVPASNLKRASLAMDIAKALEELGH